MNVWLRWGALFGLVIAMTAVTFAQAPDPAAALSGGWQLNVAASVNPSGPEPRRPAAPGGGGGGGAARGGGERPPQQAPSSISGGPPPGGSLGPEEQKRHNTHLAMFRQAPALLGIKATAKDVLLAYDPDPAKGLIFKYTTDNKKSTMATPAGPVSVKVKWDGKKLRREIETVESLKITEEYTPSADGKQLVVTVKTESSMVRMVAMEITRVYDRVQ